MIVKPVTIITGFLGAGKTTFLNALIQHGKPERYAVIENEFGKESIDGQLVLGADAGIFELNNGCLCCTLNDDLVELLTRLSKESGTFDELIIETTGIADPATVALPFLTDQIVSRYYKLDRVICLVDARHIAKELADTDEARKQISFSDVLLITKTDLVTGAELEDVKSLLTAINPTARILTGNHEQYPIGRIREFLREDAHTFAQPVSCHSHQEHRHHSLSSLTFNFREVFEIEKLGHTLMVLLAVQSQDVYRVKGIIHAKGYHEKIIIQSVAELLSISKGQPWNDTEERISRIVFIGKSLKAKGFEDLLRKGFVKEAV